MEIDIRGMREIQARLAAVAAGDGFGRALETAGERMATRAKRTVHSDKNQWKPGIATGRLRNSIGVGRVKGKGLRASVAVGSPYGETGYSGSTFARSLDSGKRNKKGQRIAAKRTGRGKNKGSPERYGVYEERYHPFFIPAVNASLGDLRKLVMAAILEPKR